MSIDGIFLYHLKKEIEHDCYTARVDKIHQPSKDELVLLLRTALGNRRLLICARPSAARVNFTETSFENPAEPPMFCMLARKHLSGAKFSHIEDNGFERIICFVFSSTNEMGDRVEVRLIVELIGNQTNILLVGSDGRILDSIRRSDLETTGRVIQPGAKYVLPEKIEKVSLLEEAPKTLALKIATSSQPLYKAIMDFIDGISPLIAREICVRANIDTQRPASELSLFELERLENILTEIIGLLANPTPTALFDLNHVPFEFSYIDITQYGDSVKKYKFESFSNLLENVYAERDRKERMKILSNDLKKTVNNLHARVLKKIAIRKKEQEKCSNGETLRIYGELLKANIYAVERGMPYVDVQNYYDSELKEVRIPLNVALSPAQNAQRYFKEYKRCCNAASVLERLIAESDAELKYIESVADELSRASTQTELKEIKEELAAGGYIRLSNQEKKVKIKPSGPIETVSPDGFTVLVGRNNRQNDELTLRTANEKDMWFHAKNIAGSHVIVVCNGAELPESTVLFAASLAAQHSKACDSSAVPVDYTRIKYIKKPSGAKPGMVIYKTNKTVYVTPRKEN